MGPICGLSRVGRGNQGEGGNFTEALQWANPRLRTCLVSRSTGRTRESVSALANPP
jgi:hypothetical protein